MNEIESYLENLGFTRNDWGFLKVKSKYDTPRTMYQTFLMDEAIKELDVEIENYKH